MGQSYETAYIVGHDAPVLVTGAGGFIGTNLVRKLLDLGFRDVRCFARSSGSRALSDTVSGLSSADRVTVFEGNLLSREDCRAATKDVAVIFHLAAGRGEKSTPDAFMNSVVTTRNLLEEAFQHGCLRRFVNVSSFAVYTNKHKARGRLLDESCEVEKHPERRTDAYVFAKVKQDELVKEYCERLGIPHVTVRPGYVYGPGKDAITGRVGIDTFGIFLHLGGSNTIPFTHVENCAEAIALAGLREGVEGEVFNIVDDELPSSRQFLRLYKQNVRRFTSLYIPHAASYLLCCLWASYSDWSQGQLPRVFNPDRWHANWKKTNYCNQKAKEKLGWRPRVTTREGLDRYFEECRGKQAHA